MEIEINNITNEKTSIEKGLKDKIGELNKDIGGLEKKNTSLTSKLSSLEKEKKDTEAELLSKIKTLQSQKDTIQTSLSNKINLLEKNLSDTANEKNSFFCMAFPPSHNSGQRPFTGSCP